MEKIRLLIVEDEPVNIALLEAILEEPFGDKIEILVAMSVEEALQMLPTVDAAVIDGNLIGGSGDEVARQCQVPYARWALRPDSELYTTGAIACIPKPCRGDDVIPVVQRLLDAVARTPTSC